MMELTTMDRGVVAPSMQSGSIRVYPPAVEFKGIEAGTLYCIVLCIQNASQISRRIRIIPPKNPAFRVKFNPSRAVAPGIDVRAEIEFLADREVDFADELTIVSGTVRVSVPLRAFAPAPLVEFDGFADLGVVVHENKVSRVIEFRNTGHLRAEINIKYDDSLPLSITPSSFYLAPKGAFMDLDKDGRMEEDEFVEGARGVWKTNVTVEFEALVRVCLLLDACCLLLGVVAPPGCCCWLASVRVSPCAYVGRVGYVSCFVVGGPHSRADRDTHIPLFGFSLFPFLLLIFPVCDTTHARM